MIPHNIYNMAIKSVGTVAFQYREATGTTINDFGQTVNTYGNWIDCRGQVQPGKVSSFGGRNISEAEYKDIGLDPSRSTITVWISDKRLASALDRKTCDQIKYEGDVYNIIQVGDWCGFNGWRYLYCQREVTV